MKQTRFLGILSLLAGITAVPLLITFYQTGWGAPGTAVYQTYELLNRLMAVALLFMAVGWVGVWRLLMGYGRMAFPHLATLVCHHFTFILAYGHQRLHLSQLSLYDRNRFSKPDWLAIAHE